MGRKALHSPASPPLREQDTADSADKSSCIKEKAIIDRFLVHRDTAHCNLSLCMLRR